MPITQRGWSLNSYALSKVWFRTRCFDLRVGDIKKITSLCKSWLYQDRFAKPQEMVIHRPHYHGGLGLHSVKYKALAGFITTFLQTAANPSFQQNLLHNLLYRKHVLLEDVPEAPVQPPPYLSQELFSIIRAVKQSTSINIIKMTEKDWSKHLTEDHITKHETEPGQSDFIPCRVELASPSTDWSLCWSSCRQVGIPPDLASFLWLMLHDLLSTQHKLHHLGSIHSPTCKMPNCTEDGTLLHELITCDSNDEVGDKLVRCLQHHVPGLEAEAVLRLEHGDISQETSLLVKLLTATTLNHIWKEKESGNRIRGYKVRAELEQSINLLRTSRLNSAATILVEMTSFMFD